MKTQTSGIGFGSLLGVVFITLKLCHVIDWSWWWVLAPLWVPAALGVTIAGGTLAVGGLLLLIAWIIERRRK